PAATAGHDHQAVDVLGAEPGAEPVPGPAAVLALVDAVDLDAGPEHVGVGGIADHGRYARPHDPGTFLQQYRLALGPGLAAVVRMQEPGRAGARDDQLRTLRRDPQRPDLQTR